jgi:hypothetical protein
VLCGKAEVGIFCCERDQARGDGRVIGGEVLVGEFTKFCSEEAELFGILFGRDRALGAGGGGVEMACADAEGEGDILRGIMLRSEAFGEVVLPGVEVVDPGFDGEVPWTDFVEGEDGGPEVIGESAEGGGLPFALRSVAIEQARGDVVVAVGEDGGGDLDGVAEDALGGMAATIDGWLDVFDDDSLAAFKGLHACCDSYGCRAQ